MSDSAKDLVSEKINYEEAVDDFLMSYKGLRKSELTISSYGFDLRLFMEFIEENKGTTTLDEATFRRMTLLYLDTLHVYGEDGKEYKVSSLNRKRIAIRRFVSFLAKRDYIHRDFTSSIEMVKNNNKPEKAVLEDNEVSKCIKVLEKKNKKARTKHKEFTSIRNLFIFITFIYTGVRVNELVNIKWSDFDFEKNNIRIRKGKGNKERVIPINTELLEELEVYKSYLSNIFENKDVFSGYLFFRSENTTDTPLSTKTARRVVEDTIKKSKIDKKITPHNLRHTFASYGIKNNMSIPVLASILGHSKNSITLDIYAHIINEVQKQEEMDKISFNINNK